MACMRVKREFVWTVDRTGTRFRIHASFRIASGLVVGGSGRLVMLRICGENISRRIAAGSEVCFGGRKVLWSDA
jgi:hypothetical protein